MGNRIFLPDFERDYDLFNRFSAEYFTRLAAARITVGVMNLARGGIVEVDLPFLNFLRNEGLVSWWRARYQLISTARSGELSTA